VTVLDGSRTLMSRSMALLQNPASNSKFDRIRLVEIEIAIGVEFPSFPSIPIPISIWKPKSTTIMRIAGIRHSCLGKDCGKGYSIRIWQLSSFS